MRLYEIIKNPFSKSLIQAPLYHGTNNTFDTFNRVGHGVYVTPVKSWAETHYGNNIIALYANVTKIKNVGWDDPISDLFYDREYGAIEEYLTNLAKEGYNCANFGGESDAMVLFNNVEIVNADTGKSM